MKDTDFFKLHLLLEFETWDPDTFPKTSFFKRHVEFQPFNKYQKYVEMIPSRNCAILHPIIDFLWAGC